MSSEDTKTRSAIVERTLPHAPEKVWRALTQPQLIQDWLMQSDFAPVIGHKFQFTADWGAVDCQVLAIEPHSTLSYTWAAYGLESVVTFTLTPSADGTHLRMEQSGFGPGQGQAYSGAKAGWANFLGALDSLLARIA